MADKGFWIAMMALLCLVVYLFVSAPPPLEEKQAEARLIPVEELFAILEEENDVIRALWTGEIVGAGRKAGLKFDEHWRDRDVEAGPLPALFLRETAKSLEKSPMRLSLFLGSDFPINPANRFEGVQLDKFRELRETGHAQFFFVPDTGLYTGMFSDFAVNEACVECHNKHEQTPKKDWRLNDMMGATTWMYPSATVSVEDLLRAVDALHHGLDEAYQAYLAKVANFANPPTIGERWPSDGYFLPSRDVFMQKVLGRTAPHTLIALAALAGKLPRGQNGEKPDVASR